MNRSGPVYLGFWTDYDANWDSRWRLTMTIRQAFVFLAFIAIGITVTASRSWKIIKFVIHQSRPHQLPRDALIREQETSLRTAETDLGSLFQMANILWNWRSFGGLLPDEVLDTMLARSRRSTWIVLTIALLHTVLFVALGAMAPVFLSGVDGNPVVLASSNSCALWDYNRSDLRAEIEYSISQAERAAAARTYYRNCYRTGAPVECRYLTLQMIPWNEYEVECPFRPGACLPRVKAIALDTGKLTPSVIGINSHLSRTMHFRKRMTCAVLNVEPFIFKYSAPSGDFYLFNLSNQPFQYDKTKDGLYPIMYPGHKSNDYVVKKVHRAGWPGLHSTGDLLELHELLDVRGGDLTIIIINKEGIMYKDMVDDPTFSAHKASPVNPIGTNVTMQFYHADDPIAMIGCIEQIQLYNKGAYRSGWQSLELEMEIFHYGTMVNHEQGPLASFIVNMLRHTGMTGIPYSWGPTLLEARTTSIEESIQLALPNDQWKREVRQWFGTGLARMQLDSLAASIGPFHHEDTSRFVNLLDDPNLSSAIRDFFCKSIKFRSPRHVSLNMFWLVILVVWASVVWILSFADGFVGRRMFTRWPHRVLAWQLDSSMHLVRQLHEHLRAGSWAPSSVASLPLAYGTLGVPTLVRENGSQWIAKFFLRVTDDNSLVEVARNLSGVCPPRYAQRDLTP